MPLNTASAGTRHSCALRMARDQRLSMRDIQVILGHAELTTTQIYLEDDDHEVIHRVQGYLVLTA
jgi:integrase/recombinase XerD